MKSVNSELNGGFYEIINMRLVRCINSRLSTGIYVRLHGRLHGRLHILETNYSSSMRVLVDGMLILKTKML